MTCSCWNKPCRLFSVGKCGWLLQKDCVSSRSWERWYCRLHLHEPWFFTPSSQTLIAILINLIHNWTISIACWTLRLSNFWGFGYFVMFINIYVFYNMLYNTSRWLYKCIFWCQSNVGVWKFESIHREVIHWLVYFNTRWGYIIVSDCFVIINIIFILRQEVNAFKFDALVSSPKRRPCLPAASVGQPIGLQHPIHLHYNIRNG